MYCPVNNSENSDRRSRPHCCRLYNLALAFLAAIILFVIGLIFGALFFGLLLGSIPLLVAVVAILFIIFIVTLLTRGCCRNEDEE